MRNTFIIAASVLAALAAGVELKAQAERQTGGRTNAPAEPANQARVKEPTGSEFQGEVKINGQPPPALVRTEVGAKPEGFFYSGIELRTPKPNNVIQSKKHPGIEYSGMLVQVVRNNPLQLINPFAPAKYGDGEVNIVRNPATRKAEGLKVFQITAGRLRF